MVPHLSLIEPLFRDRLDSGQQLAQVVLSAYTQLVAQVGDMDVVVYGLPRGGVVVAEPIAQLLRSPLHVLVAKKIASLENPELAIGAVTASGQLIRTRVHPRLRGADWAKARQRAEENAKAQWQQFSPYCPEVNSAGKLAILVDDGIATGMTMAVAARTVRLQQPAHLWICAPVAPSRMVDLLNVWCDRCILLATPEPFSSVSRFYQSFTQVETEDVIACLQRHNSQFGRFPVDR
ncbi:phosphoribosyltransferase [Leptolyngbya sp. AN02str]|uniref:phosphoribosyltransferase n=1 Tax=Leptolyngbya sp. AN02str TaxID=3423363 RepID=UPI003D3212C8